MDVKSARLKIDKLRAAIDKYRYHRLVLDKPIIEESVEDSLKKELFEIEQKFPSLITPDSPTQRVGGKPLDKFEKFSHPSRMLSLNDAFNRSDIEEWLARLKRIDPRAGLPSGEAGLPAGRQENGGYFCELKLDGLAIELVYEKGLLKVGATRGDGMIGENVTQNLRTIESIPLQFSTLHSPPVTSIVVRGEVFITKKEFGRINKELADGGEETYANPRNLAAGSIRQLDPAITASRRMDSYAYSLVSDLGQKIHEEEHEILGKFGFKINPHNKFCKTLDEVQEFRDYWEKHRELLPYEIDGIVVIVNDNRMLPN